MANSSHIQSVLKAAQMLRIIGESGGGIKLSEIARLMEQKLPAIHHLSSTLISCGFIRKDGDNVLTLGAELIKLAGKSAGDLLLDAAGSELTRLYTLYPQSVIVLAEVNPPKVETSLRISYERPNVIQTESGQVHNIYVNAVALMSLALIDERGRELMMDKQPFCEYGALLWNTRDKLEEFLAQARGEGVVVSPFDRQTSFRIAAPITGKNGVVRGALGMSIPASRMALLQEAELSAQLKESARRVSDKIASM